ncbi:MAG: DUF63 family protein [Methanosarcinaceae archaeon]|nr:DUF63 family protein [Methanosarcinaceae archaeon]
MVFMSFLESVTSFIHKYYISPIIHDSGYNIFNTLTWALILIVCVYFIIYAFNKLKIKVDDKFFLALLPFILSGSVLRVVADASIVSAPYVYLLITPNIYFVVFLVASFLLLSSVLLERFKIISDYRKLFFVEGTIILLFLLAILSINSNVTHAWVLFAVIFGGLLWVLIFYAIFKIFRLKIHMNLLNFTIVFSHMADATSTFVGIDFLGYNEKHVLPSFLIDLTGTALVMYVLKFIVVILIIWGFDYICKIQLEESKDESEDKNDINNMKLLINSLKIVVIILGMAPAIRNTLRMFFGI